jgi:effector-binding domain-containing protein
MGDAFAALTAYAGRHALQCAGPPRAIYTSWGAQGTEFTVAMPIPVPGSPALPEEGVSVATIPGGHMLRFTHTGRYDEVAGTYEQIAHWLRDAGLMKTEADWSRFMPMWEEYLNDPNSTPASELLTYIYLPKH